jgi:hypothetical protein
MPSGGLFLEPWIYNWALADEYAVNAYWAGNYLGSLRMNIALLTRDETPRDTVKRLATNADASLGKLMPRFTSNTSLVFSD